MSVQTPESTVLCEQTAPERGDTMAGFLSEAAHRGASELLLIALEFEKEEDALDFAERYEAGADFVELAGRFIEDG